MRCNSDVIWRFNGWMPDNASPLHKPSAKQPVKSGPYHLHCCKRDSGGDDDAEPPPLPRKVRKASSSRSLRRARSHSPASCSRSLRADLGSYDRFEVFRKALETLRLQGHRVMMERRGPGNISSHYTISCIMREWMTSCCITLQMYLEAVFLSECRGFSAREPWYEGGWVGECQSKGPGLLRCRD